AAINAIATRNGFSYQNTAWEGAVGVDSGCGGASTFAQAARCVDEALRGGFLGDLDEINEADGESASDSDSGDYEAGDMSSGEGSALWLHDDEPYSASTSARGVVEQVIARMKYEIKRQMRVFPTIHAALDQITRRDLDNPRHLPIHEQFTHALEALAARFRGLLPSVTSSQNNTQLPAASQHNTHTHPLPPSPEKRQYRKDSRSIH
ncbi:unnamed protein product, partial [Rhizoctonia solani]